MNRSFRPTGTTTSFTRGMPRRETWTKGPERDWVPSAYWVLMLRRSAVVQMPTIPEPSPPWVRSELGTCKAKLFTLNPLRVSSPDSEKSRP